MAVHLAEKGRGRALKHVWGNSPAEVLVYLDEDLSTDLAALPPLVAPLLSGHSDLAIGTRLGRSARVTRGGKREFISRSYNLLLRRTMAVGFTDAQCGFKAIRRDVADRLLPLVEDNAWFFDTELLILAERAGMRIHEIPVDWVDDPDSSVDIVVDRGRGHPRDAAGRHEHRARAASRSKRSTRSSGEGRSNRRGHPASSARSCASARSACSRRPRSRCSTCVLQTVMAAQAANFVALLLTDDRQHLGQPTLHLRRAGQARSGAATSSRG